MPAPRVLAAAVLIACATVAATAPAAVAAPAHTDRAPVRFHLTHNHTVLAPRTVRPGIAELSNSGRGAIVAVETRRHVSTAQVARILNASAHSSQPSLRGFTILGVLTAHHPVYARLFRGSLFLFDADRDHFTSATVRRAAVRGHVLNADVAGAQPLALDRSDRLSAPAAIPTSGLFRLTSAASTLTGLVALRVGADVAQRTVDAFVAHPTDDGIDTLHPAAVLPVGIAWPAAQSWVPYRLAAGRYVLIAAALHGKHLVHAGGVRALVVR